MLSKIGEFNGAIAARIVSRSIFPFNRRISTGALNSANTMECLRASADNSDVLARSVQARPSRATREHRESVENSTGKSLSLVLRAN